MVCVFLLGKRALVCVNLHVPHNKHHIDLEEALGSLHHIMNLVPKRCRTHLKLHPDQIRYLFCGDVNADLRNDSARSAGLHDFFSAFQCEFVLPESPDLASLFSWETGSEKLVDWLACSSEFHSKCIPSGKQYIETAGKPDLQHLTKSNHFPIGLRLDLRRIVEARKVPLEGHKHFEALLRVPRSWKPDSDTKQHVARVIEGNLEDLNSIHDFNRAAVVSCASVVRAAPRCSPGKFKDSEAIKSLVARKAACTDKQARGELSLSIFSARNLERNEHKQKLCEQLANQSWHHKPELERHMRDSKCTPKPIALKTPLHACIDVWIDEPDLTQQEYTQYLKATEDIPPSEWPEEFCSFWNSVFQESDENIQFYNCYLDCLYVQVHAFMMANRLDGQQPKGLFTEELVKQGIEHLKTHRTNDPSGMTAELAKVLASSDNIIEKLTSLFNDRSTSPPPPLFSAPSPPASCSVSVPGSLPASHPESSSAPSTSSSPCPPLSLSPPLPPPSPSTLSPSSSSSPAPAKGHIGKHQALEVFDLLSDGTPIDQNSNLSFACERFDSGYEPASWTNGPAINHVEAWHQQLCVLIDKEVIMQSIEQMRPITILHVLLKLYMWILYGMIMPMITFGGWHQHGARQGVQCLEVVHAIRALIEKSLEWSFSLMVLSIDIHEAYDSLCLMAVIAILEIYKIPLLVRYAFIREIFATKTLNMFYDGVSLCTVVANKGFRQDSPEASFCFAVIVGHLLAMFDRKWRSQNCGIFLGKWGGCGVAFSEWWEERLASSPLVMGLMSKTSSCQLWVFLMTFILSVIALTRHKLC
jgi:hypothetical protein